MLELTAVAAAGGVTDIRGLLMCALLIMAGEFMQTVIHETGHLIGGAATSHRLIFFRAGIIMLARDEKGKFRLRRLKSGISVFQCMMVPRRDRFFLYNCGGIIANILLTAAGAVLYFTCGRRLIFAAAAVCGAVKVISNSLPVFRKGAPTDMKILRIITSSAEQRRDYFGYIRSYEIFTCEKDNDKVRRHIEGLNASADTYFGGLLLSMKDELLRKYPELCEVSTADE